MASVASQLIEEVTALAQRDSLEDAREICAVGTYFANNLRTYHKTRVSIFSKNLSATFLILKRIQRDIIVNVELFMYNTYYFCQNLIKFELFLQIFEKPLNIKFNENASRGNRVFPCGQRDRQTVGLTIRCDEADSPLRNFAKAP